jgi:anti-sigma-K factor RskA
MAHPTPDDLALIALGEAVSPEDAAHAGECLACLTEIEALQHVVVVGRSLGPDDTLLPPHARVWEQISAQVPTASGAQPTATGPAHPDGLAARRLAPRRRWAPVAVAAAAALVVGLGGGYALKSLSGASSDAAGTTTTLNALPGWPGASGKAVIEDAGGGQRTLVVSVQLPATASVDGTMEVWMSDTRARDMVALGTMSGDSARIPVPASFDLATHPIVDVSLEPSGDTDPHHSDVSVVRGRLNV